MTERTRANYLTTVQEFHLWNACRIIEDAYGSVGFGTYLVGSCLRKRDYRDVDVRCILEDEAFETLFPDATANANGRLDARSLLVSIAISEMLSRLTGLPIDFQFQKQSVANALYPSPEHGRQFLGFPYRQSMGE